MSFDNDLQTQDMIQYQHTSFGFDWEGCLDENF